MLPNIIKNNIHGLYYNFFYQNHNYLKEEINKELIKNAKPKRPGNILHVSSNHYKTDNTKKEK